MAGRWRQAASTERHPANGPIFRSLPMSGSAGGRLQAIRRPPEAPLLALSAGHRFSVAALLAQPFAHGVLEHADLDFHAADMDLVDQTGCQTLVAHRGGPVILLAEHPAHQFHGSLEATLHLLRIRFGGREQVVIHLGPVDGDGPDDAEADIAGAHDDDPVRKADIAEDHNPPHLVMAARNELAVEIAAMRGVTDVWADPVDLVFGIGRELRQRVLVQPCHVIAV